MSRMVECILHLNFKRLLIHWVLFFLVKTNGLLQSEMIKVETGSRLEMQFMSQENLTLMNVVVIHLGETKELQTDNISFTLKMFEIIYII